jgi:hypothetical protein
LVQFERRGGEEEMGGILIKERGDKGRREENFNYLYVWFKRGKGRGGDGF